MKKAEIWILVVCLLGGFGPAALAEESPFVAKAFPESDDRDWTPEDFLNARPLPLPTVPDELLDVYAYEEPDLEESPVWEGEASPPTLGIKPDPRSVLFDPQEFEQRAPFEDDEEKIGVPPKNRGSTKLDFTSSRLVPLSADQQYPYRAVGKLFFQKPEGGFVCSGATIGPRLVLTAGHCVHDGLSRRPDGYFSDFVFIPAYRDGRAPYGRWRASMVITTRGWAESGAVVPSRDDFAILVIPDRGGKRIGDVVGWLGWSTNRLKPNHVTMIGYPGNLDNGEKMHQVNAGKHRTSARNTVLYGSDMRGGSSGGPWIQNFGVEADGQSGGLNTRLNRVVGVASYGPTALAPKYQGSSILTAAFTSIRKIACDQASGNC